MAVLYSEAERAVADVLADADLGDPFALDVVMPEPDDDADLAELVAEWRRLDREHRNALRVAAWFGMRAREARTAAERLFARDPDCWSTEPIPGLEYVHSLRLSGGD